MSEFSGSFPVIAGFFRSLQALLLMVIPIERLNKARVVSRKKDVSQRRQGAVHTFRFQGREARVYLFMPILNAEMVKMALAAQSSDRCLEEKE